VTNFILILLEKFIASFYSIPMQSGRGGVQTPMKLHVVIAELSAPFIRCPAEHVAFTTTPGLVALELMTYSNNDGHDIAAMKLYLLRYLSPSDFSEHNICMRCSKQSINQSNVKNPKN